MQKKKLERQLGLDVSSALIFGTIAVLCFLFAGVTGSDGWRAVALVIAGGTSFISVLFMIWSYGWWQIRKDMLKRRLVIKTRGKNE